MKILPVNFNYKNTSLNCCNPKPKLNIQPSFKSELSDGPAMTTLGTDVESVKASYSHRYRKINYLNGHGLDANEQELKDIKRALKKMENLEVSYFKSKSRFWNTSLDKQNKLDNSFKKDKDDLYENIYKKLDKKIVEEGIYKGMTYGEKSKKIFKKSLSNMLSKDWDILFYATERECEI